MAVVPMDTFCAALGVSAWIALLREGALIPPLQRSPSSFLSLLPSEPAAPLSGRALVRSGIADQQARPGQAGLADTRSLAKSSSHKAVGKLSRTWITLAVALLAGIVACTYLADGVGAEQWLLPCVGIPLIVAVVNLLGPADR